MKKLILTLCTAYVVLSSFGQINQIHKDNSGHLKSANGEKMKLDSIIIGYYISESDSFSTAAKHEFRYSSTGKQILESWFVWKSVDKLLKINDQWVYEYNSNDSLIRNTYLHWYADSSKLIPNSKEEFDYDSNGNKILDASFEYDPFYTHSWIGKNKTEYEFDANGSKILEKYFIWDNNKNDWIEKNLYEYSYNSSGSVTLESRYNWDSSGNTWTGDYKYVYNLDSENNLLFKENYQWLHSVDDWVLNAKFKYEYEINNNLSTTLELTQNLETTLWDNHTKTETYESAVNENDNQIIEIYYNWNNTIDTGVVQQKGNIHLMPIIIS